MDDRTADEAALKGLEQRLFTSIRTRDRAALSDLLADGFELQVPGQAPVPKGAFIDSVVSMPVAIVSIESDDLRARVVTPGVGVITGRQRASVRAETGAVETDIQAFADVAEWKDGRWRLVFAHSVTVPP